MMKDSIEKNVKLSYESRHMEIERKSERILVEHVLYVGLFFLLLIATITDGFADELFIRIWAVHI